MLGDDVRMVVSNMFTSDKCCLLFWLMCRLLDVSYTGLRISSQHLTVSQNYKF